jgi:ribulose-5-phosphate 4-epimerase/fuculose-1-phosphate aldolase
MKHRELICAVHTHTRANNAIAMQKDGLLPLTQKALSILSFVRYHDFEGAEMELNKRDRIVRDPENGRIAILRNHGALTVGETVAEAFVWMFRLETACRYQVDGLAGGRELQLPSRKTIERTVQQGRDGLGKHGFLEVGKLEWPSLLRKVERERGTLYRC